MFGAQGNTGRSRDHAACYIAKYMLHHEHLNLLVKTRFSCKSYCQSKLFKNEQICSSHQTNAEQILGAKFLLSRQQYCYFQ